MTAAAVQSAPPALVVRRLGRRPYDEVLAEQEALVAAVAAGAAPEQLLLLEHPPTYTLGRGADAADLRDAPARLGVPVHRVGRGGGATFHGPGQLVAYPIVRLRAGGRDVHGYVRGLERALIATAAAFGVAATTRDGEPGIWVGARKLGSIGIGVRRGVAYHGIALNLSTDLAYFAAIVICRSDRTQMVNLAELTGATPSLAEVGDAFARALAAELHLLPSPAPAGEGQGGGPAPAGEGRGGGARRHPEWIKVRAPGGEGYAATKRTVNELGLHTVCEEARCPNVAECWGHRTATFMLLGDVCTRNCGYCAVAHGKPIALDPHEPAKVADGVARLGLRHVVITSVDRDDLPDGGAAHFAATARAIKQRLPDCAVEVLTPDFKGDLDALGLVVDAPIDVFNHNTETVPRLYKRARPGGRYDRCLGLLAEAKRRRPALRTKTGLMLGLGEQRDEVVAVMRDLIDVGCDILTLGQYLQPTRKHLPIVRYLPPQEFAELREIGLGLGFRHVESGPLVRSSYHAWEHV